METVTLILPLEATTVNIPSNSKSDSGVTAGVTVKLQQERWESNMEPQTQLRLLNAIITRLLSFHLECFLRCQTPL